MKSLKKKWWKFFVLALLIIQFIRIDKSVTKTNPKDDYLVMANVSPEMALMIKNACYDCHSYETEYPWYAEVAPVSWWIKGHIDHGRDKLNFSIWNSYPAKKQNHKLEECVEKLEGNLMPLKSFTWVHSEARLSDDQRKEMIAWFNQ